MARETLRETTAERQLRQLDEAGLLDLLVAEIINGELVVRGAPRLRHQEIVTRLIATLAAWTETHGGAVYGGPVGVELDRDHQVRPDVALVVAARRHLVDDDGFRVGPDLVVEVVSSGTKSLDMVEKRDIYQALGVPEYWIVDPDAGHVLVHRLDAGRYGAPERVGPGASIEPARVSGLTVAVDALLR